MAAPIDLAGTGTFKPLSAEQLTNLPATIAFSKSDLASGVWSFQVRYDDSVADSDPDFYVGRYSGAVQSFRLTVGATTIELPASRAELVVSDGGLGFPDRESIRIEASMPTPSGILRAAWIQANRVAKATDLRGAPGLLASDALPPASQVANLATASAFDRFLLLRMDAPQGSTPPLLYITSSKLSVQASRATTAVGK